MLQDGLSRGFGQPARFGQAGRSPVVDSGQWVVGSGWHRRVSRRGHRPSSPVRAFPPGVAGPAEFSGLGAFRGHGPPRCFSNPRRATRPALCQNGRRGKGSGGDTASVAVRRRGGRRQQCRNSLNNPGLRHAAPLARRLLSVRGHPPAGRGMADRLPQRRRNPGGRLDPKRYFPRVSEASKQWRRRRIATRANLPQGG